MVGLVGCLDVGWGQEVGVSWLGLRLDVGCWMLDQFEVRKIFLGNVKLSMCSCETIWGI